MKRAGTKTKLGENLFVQVWNVGEIKRNGQVEHEISIANSEGGMAHFLTVKELQSILDWYNSEEMTNERKT